MQSKAKTVDAYLAELTDERRQALSAVREVIRKNLSQGFEEGMQYGMIGYYVPHSVYPAGYHCDPKQPLPYAGLASQKNHISFYLMSLYGHLAETKKFEEEWKASGKKLDMGKCCVRFKKIEDASLEAIGAAIARMPLARYLEIIEQSWSNRKSNSSGASGKQAAKKIAPKPTNKKPVTGKAASGKAVTGKAGTSKPASKKATTTNAPTKKGSTKKSTVAKSAAKKSTSSANGGKKSATKQVVIKNSATKKAAPKKAVKNVRSRNTKTS